MAKNNPPNLTSYIQDARREGYKGTNREEAIKYLKNKNNEGDGPNYGTTMKKEKNGGGTNYFSMNYMANKNNAQDADTTSTFKNPDGVAMAGGTYGLNDGHMNYGTPINDHKPGHLSPKEVENQSIGTKATGVGGNYGDRTLPGIKNIRIGKEVGNTDLLDVAKGAYKKFKNWMSS